MNNRLVLALLLVVAGCASSGPKDSRYAVDGNAEGPSGIVFGKLCEGNGLWFKETSSIKEIPHVGSTPEFALRLPVGKYALTSISSSSGTKYTSRNPFNFEVRANEVVYIGTLLPAWANEASQVAERCGKEQSIIVGKKLYGLKQSDSPVQLANDKEEAIKAVNARYPDLDLRGAIVRLMY